MKSLIYLLLFAVCVFCSCDKDSEKPTTDSDVPENHPVNIPNPDVQEDVSERDNRPTDKYCFIQVFIDADTLMGLQDRNIDQKLYPQMTLYMDGAKYDWEGSYGSLNYLRKVGGDNFVFEGGFGSSPIYYVTPNDEVLPVDTDELAAMERANLAVFKKYSEQLGDTALPKSERSWHYSPNNIDVIINKIEGIEVICNKDFDENHPQGSSVSDILTFYGSTPVKYIKRGYKWMANSKITIPENMGFHYLETIVSNAAEIANKNFEFYGGQFYLYFTQLPSQPGTYTFDVTIKFPDKELKKTVSMTF